MQQLFSTLHTMFEYIDKFVGGEILLCTVVVITSFLCSCLKEFKHSI